MVQIGVTGAINGQPPPQRGMWWGRQPREETQSHALTLEGQRSTSCGCFGDNSTRNLKSNLVTKVI